MDFKIFFSTFSLIFLAELGDKTQLAAFAASAGTKSPISIFLGAATALVFSTLVAVSLGNTLQRIVPVYYLKVGAGVLFLVFGTLLLVSVIKPVTVLVEAVGVNPRKGVLTKVVLASALEFEKASSENYLKLAETATTNQLKDLFIRLAKEEEQHLEHLTGIMTDYGDKEYQKEVPVAGQIVEPSTDKSAIPTIISDAIAHEKSTAGFYKSLAEHSLIPSVKKTLLQLASEEESHIKHLEEFIS